MDWLLISILAYLCFGVSSLCDKLVLSNKAKPNVYAFYVGIFGLFALLLIPFIKNFGLPTQTALYWIVITAIVHIIAIYSMYSAIQKFEVSKVVPVIGAVQSVFIFALTPIFWVGEKMPAEGILAFVLLLLGSAIISFEKNIKITLNFLKITIFSALMFAFDYIGLKFIFLNQPFLQGVVWLSIFLFIFSLFFIIKKSSRQEIFEKNIVLNKKTQFFFLGAQVIGGAGNLLQSFAISLAPTAFLAVVNSLKGIQYVFLFFLTITISFLFPKILKEEVLKIVIYKKLFAIFLIAIGLMLLVL